MRRGNASAGWTSRTSTRTSIGRLPPENPALSPDCGRGTQYGLSAHPGSGPEIPVGPEWAAPV